MKLNALLVAFLVTLPAPVVFAEAPTEQETATPFILELKRVEVYPKRADGRRWDAIVAGGPDLLVQMRVDGALVLNSRVQKDTFSATWNLPSDPFSLEGSEGSVRIVVLDKDLRNDETIGELSFTISRE